MKKQIITTITICIFLWTSIIGASNLATPNGTPQQVAENGNILQLNSEPVISITSNHILIICKANCGAKNAEKVYALYQGKKFPPGTNFQVVETKLREKKIYTVEYQLPDNTAWFPITTNMVTDTPPQLSSTEPPMEQPTTISMRYQRLEKKGKNKRGKDQWQVVEDNNFIVLGIPLVYEKGKPVVMNVIVKDKETGNIIVIAPNVKITHWGKTIRTLGVVAGLTISAGVLIYWAPGVIIAATPIFP